MYDSSYTYESEWTTKVIDNAGVLTSAEVTTALTMFTGRKEHAIMSVVFGTYLRQAARRRPAFMLDGKGKETSSSIGGTFASPVLFVGGIALTVIMVLALKKMFTISGEEISDIGRVFAIAVCLIFLIFGPLLTIDGAKGTVENFRMRSTGKRLLREGHESLISQSVSESELLEIGNKLIQETSGDWKNHQLIQPLL